MTDASVLPWNPFAYPSEPHVRRHGPSGYAEYGSYKPWLRDEFTFRCVYCLSRETWYPNGTAGFAVEHLMPQSSRPDLATVYGNLVYACNRCNSIKRDATRVPDPAQVAFASLLFVDEIGRIRGLTDEGGRLIDLLRLDSDSATRVRLENIMVLRAKQLHPEDTVIDTIFRTAFGYPADIEDLRGLHPPGRNSVAGSEQDCYFARRSRGELPPVY